MKLLCFLISISVSLTANTKGLLCKEFFIKHSYNRTAWHAVNMKFQNELAITILTTSHNSSQSTIIRSANTSSKYQKLYKKLGIDTKHIGALVYKQSINNKSTVQKLTDALPSLEQWSTNVQALQIEYLQAWNKRNPNQQISMRDVIHPALLFYNAKKDKWKVIKIGEAVPLGFEPQYTFPGKDLTPGYILYPAISRGLFPLMLDRAVFHHDWLGHFVSYITNPNYAVAYRELTQEIVRQGGFMRLSTMSKQLLIEFNESLFLVSKQHLRPHLNAFHLPREPAKYGEVGYTKEQILKTIEHLAYTDILQSKNNILSALEVSAKKMGGLVAENLIEKNPSQIGSQTLKLEEQIRIYESMRKSNTGSLEIQLIKVKEALAELESQILLHSEHTAKEIADMITNTMRTGNIHSYLKLINLGEPSYDRYWDQAVADRLIQ